MRILFPLLLAFAILLAACGGGEATPTDSPSPTPRPTAPPTPVPTPTPTPTPSPTPTPATTPSPYAGSVIDLSGSHTRQGGFLAVRLLYPPEMAGEPVVALAGSTYPMTSAGDRWFGYIGLPTWFTVGGYPLEVWADGAMIVSGWLEVAEGGFVFEQLNLPPGSSGDLLTDAARIEAERQEVNATLAGYTSERYFSGAWITPTTGNITDTFGTQRSINGGAYFPHSGLDIANDDGTPIYAAASGYVALSKQLFLYGNSVIIDHGVGVFSGYNHMSQALVSVGDYVNQGDLIGYMGSTGLSTGPHLHWEAVVHGVRVDPALWTEGGIDP